MYLYLIGLLSSFFLVYILIPVAKKFAWKVRLLDMPTGRKAHGRPMPLSGGIAMYAGIGLILLLLAGDEPLVWMLLFGGALLIGVGTVDDWFKANQLEFPVSPKLIVQMIVALMAFVMDIRFEGMNLSLFADQPNVVVFPLWLSLIATIIWIVGLINMVNFLDGADGLAGGVVTLSATTMFFISYVKQQDLTAMIAIVLVGGTLAFLRFNFYPAQLFMGDAGATFLGLCLALISLEGVMKGATLLSLVVTVLALGLPVMDTLQVMVSRMLAGKPMYQADRRHMHHRLMSKGLTAKQTVVVLYIISVFFSAVSLLLFLYMI
ncbi:MraY family glycosyltransferase [Brevibacillus sp. SYSU BS000544]|uniref:MraY family glycosyltransferase n=1 Tax=Brevibacillus sp. SYSU BS000544 TaxID=3416443 RepID=UPI003CE4F6CF